MRGFSLAAIALLTTTSAFAQTPPPPLPSPAGTDPATEEEGDAEVVVEVTTANAQLPVLLVLPATASDEQLADQLRTEVELTGLFATPSPRSLNLGMGLPDTSKWPALTTAAVVVGRVPPGPGGGFPIVNSSTHHRATREVARKRELVEYPGSEAMTIPVLTDAILEDVLGIRSHMSGRVVFTDASIRGERSIRVMAPDGKRPRRISGFGSMAKGADFAKDNQVWFAAEDASGKLRLFKENQPTPVETGLAGYLQSISFSPTGKYLALSMGEGRRVNTWVGQRLNALQAISLGQDMSSLSPTVDDTGKVVHTVGKPQGPFSVYVNDKPVTSGVWAAAPSFCSTAIEDRVVYMVRSGARWDVRITSLTNGSSRMVASNGQAPVCSPDGRTVAFFSPGRGGKNPGIYLVGDIGGPPHKVWDGEASGIRWARGEKLPARKEERVAPPPPAQKPAASTESADDPYASPHPQPAQPDNPYATPKPEEPDNPYATPLAPVCLRCAEL